MLYDATNDRVVLCDFGIAHFTDEQRYTSTETQPGTRLANFQYSAPEQRNPGANVDHRADIYALGLILNEFFTDMFLMEPDLKPLGQSHLSLGT